MVSYQKSITSIKGQWNLTIGSMRPQSPMRVRSSLAISMIALSALEDFRVEEISSVISFWATRITRLPWDDQRSFMLSIALRSACDKCVIVPSFCRIVVHLASRTSGAPLIHKFLGIISVLNPSDKPEDTYISCSNGDMIRIIYLFLLLNGISNTFLQPILRSCTDESVSENLKIA